MVITTFAIRGRTAAAVVITPLMWEIVCTAVAGRKKSPPHQRDGDV